MPARLIQSDADHAALIKLLAAQKMPYTVQITKGRNRSLEQNKLQRMWINEAAEQLGDQTPEELRGLMKLTVGVPILRAENEDFCEKYDRIIKHLPYTTKLEMMMEPLDFPVTRLMTTGQTTEYLDGIKAVLAEQGVILTEPR